MGTRNRHSFSGRKKGPRGGGKWLAGAICRSGGRVGKTGGRLSACNRGASAAVGREGVDGSHLGIGGAPSIVHSSGGGAWPALALGVVFDKEDHLAQLAAHPDPVLRERLHHSARADAPA